MPLQLYGHPFSSYTQKVLTALYENATPFDFRWIGPDAPGGADAAAEVAATVPLRKFPVLVDDGRTVVETTIIIEYLQLRHPGPVRLLPQDPMAALDVRFLDRYFDLHVMNVMQIAVNGALSGDPVKRRDGLAEAVEKLERAYAWLEDYLVGRTWAVGEDFTLADCAAAPSLFYADWTHAIAAKYPLLAGPTARGCWRDRRLRGRWRRRGRSGHTSRWGRRTGTSFFRSGTCGPSMLR